MLDATLGVRGLPQSATGQTSLLTGINAAKQLGRHHGPHPGPSLLPLLATQSLHAQMARAGLSCWHANGYSVHFLQLLERSRHRPLSAFAFSALSTGQRLLPQGNARTVDPLLTDPEETAGDLAQLCQEHDLVILEYWLLDYTGHRSPEKVPEALLRLWRLIESLRQYSLGLALVSDHGNAEENWHSAHTENPVPLVVSGPLATKLRPLRNLADFSPWLLEAGGLLE